MKKSNTSSPSIDLNSLHEDNLHEITSTLSDNFQMSENSNNRLNCCCFIEMKMRHLAPLHVLYIIMAGFFYATIFYLLELENPKTNFPYVDALFISFSNVCVSGFLNHSIEYISLPSQVCLFFAMLSGTCFVTMIPISFVKFLNSRKQMLNKKKEEFNNNSHNTDIVILELTPIPTHESLWRRIIGKVSKLFKLKSSQDESAYDYYKINEIEYYSLIWINLITYIYILFVLILGFLIIGIVFSVNYNSDYNFLKGKNPFWMGIFISVSAFVNCGTTLLDEGLTNFVSDPIILLTISFLVLFGNVLFPMSLRYIFLIIYKLSSKRRIVFKYILEKHHHLSPFIYPGIQTTIYGIVTLFLLLIAFIITIAMDHNSPIMSDKSIVVKMLISFFHPVNARNGGIAAIDLVNLSFPTLITYTFLMYIKPQMACSLREKAYKIVDMVRHIKDGEKSPSSPNQDSNTKTELVSTTTAAIDSNSNRTASTTSENVKNSSTIDNELISVKIESTNQTPIMKKLLEEEQKVYGYSLPISVSNNTNRISEKMLSEQTPSIYQSPYIPSKFSTIMRRGCTKFRKIMKRSLSDFWFYLSTMLSTSNMWMILFVFSISIAENEKLIQQPDKFSLYKILFEVISAFSNTGFSLGMPGSLLSFSAYFTPFSKMLICVVMVLGRHRGFYGTLIDMELDSYDSQNFTQHVNYMQRRDFLKQYKKQVKSLHLRNVDM